MGDERGITAEDLPEIYRQGYLHAIESARAEYDPGTEWDDFREYLWSSLVQSFGLGTTEWPSSTPRRERSRRDPTAHRGNVEVVGTADGPDQQASDA